MSPSQPKSEKTDPRLWWLPMPLLVVAAVAAFYAGRQLEQLNRSMNDLNKHMLTTGQFKDWCYSTERINVGSNWSAGNIPPRD